MNLLLDTHAFLWWWQGSASLKAEARKAIEAADIVYVSAASAWEMAIKESLGRLRFEGAFADAVRKCRFETLPIGFAHTEVLRTLPRHHSDPFDRMLVAQARVDGLSLVTHDRLMDPYGIAIVWT